MAAAGSCRCSPSAASSSSSGVFEDEERRGRGREGVYALWPARGEDLARDAGGSAQRKRSGASGCRAQNRSAPEPRTPAPAGSSPNGTKATANIGPNLTHLARRSELGGGVLQNTPENLRRWLKNPQQFKPGSHMPDLKLTNEQADRLAVYLESL